MNRREVIKMGVLTAGGALLAQFPCPGTAESSMQGAEMPWETHLSSEMSTTGTVLGPTYGPFLVEMESSGQRCVKLSAAGEHVEFTARSPANAMIIRYSLPDSPTGEGIEAGLDLYRNGELLRTLSITSRYSWLYGAYPFTNDPQAGRPRNFYDEVRVQGVEFAAGDVIRLQKLDDGAAYCILDLVDLEQVVPPLTRPANSLSAMDFGADGRGEADDTEALRRCLAEAAKQGKSVWVPAGRYKLTGEIAVPPHVTLQGAGLWHTIFVGDEALYAQPDRRAKLVLRGSGSHLADFSLIGRLRYRDDKEANDGIIGHQADGFTVSRVWIEHTKSGMWFYGCANGIIEGCRLRNTRADGINICTHSRNLVAVNCTARNTGDDCFAIWPAAFDHDHIQHSPAPGGNVIRNCTGQLPYLANGGALYGGTGNRIENCRFTDISAGCGILISTTFPTVDEAYGIDYGFGGVTRVRGCRLERCGGYDHEWQWRAAFQICLERRSISGVAISAVTIRDSLSDGFSIVAPGAKRGQGRLSSASLDDMTIAEYGLAVPDRHGLWARQDASGSIALSRSRIADIRNDSSSFTILEG